jgi:hypothetical protein
MNPDRCSLVRLGFGGLLCAVAAALGVSLAIAVGDGTGPTTPPLLPREGKLYIRGHITQRGKRQTGVLFGKLQMEYFTDVTVTFHCVGCRHGTPSTRRFVGERRMRGVKIPAHATLYVRIVRRGWIGYYVTLRDAGREAPHEQVRCLWPGSKHPRACPPQAPVTTTSVSTPTTPTASTATVPPGPPPDRTAITSVNSTGADLAPFAGEFTVADQPFEPRSNVVTYVGVTIGNPNLPPGPSSDTVEIRLCMTVTCEGGALATAAATVDNYGLSAAGIGEIAVVPGNTYYLVWTPPADGHGTHWLAYWHGGGPTVAVSKEMEALVRGYNSGAPGSRRAIIDYAGRRPPPAPYAGPFVYAFLNFKAASDTITRLGVTLGNPKLPRDTESVETVVVRLCETPDCTTGVLATATPHIVNYGVTEADIGEVAVTPGTTYFVNWQAPRSYEGAGWVTFWFGPGPRLEESTLTEAFAKGYNRGGEPALTTYYVEQEGNLGAPTFSDPTAGAGEGPRVESNATVEVSCKLFDLEIASIEPDGYWYRLHSAPYNDMFYAAANTFWNGAASGGEVINTDLRVPVCTV